LLARAVLPLRTRPVALTRGTLFSVSALPATCSEFVERTTAFWKELEAFKKNTVIADYGWYPYGSMSVLPILGDLFKDEYREIAHLLSAEPAADLGCGDGDFASLFAKLGVDMVAVDHAESNFNQMRGAERLARESGGRLKVLDIDLDGHFDLPRPRYGLVLFLGTLYHLKNPFYVLERLAERAAYCVLSTRIAQLTPDHSVTIESEALAYLLNPREANNDPTNFWIFSHAGLMRLLDRAGWMVLAQKRAGCLERSDPVKPDADERIFLLLKSRIRYPDLQVLPLSGWHEVEQGAWRWTMKRFALEAVLPKDLTSREFALRFMLPETVVSQSGGASLECRIHGERVGRITCDAAGSIEFRGVFPAAALSLPSVVLEFEVHSSFAPPGDQRELGVVIPLLDSTRTGTHRIPFRIS
jgi:tRNA (mo5U34)-methyltransferase